MKKIVALLLASVMVLSLAACGGSTTAEAPAETQAAETQAAETQAAKEEAKAEEPAAEEAAAEGLPYEGVTLEFWMPPYTGEDMSYWEPELEKFTALTGAKVNVSMVDWGEMSTKYMAGFMSGDGPDVFYMTNEIMYDMADAGALLDLSPYFTQEEKDNLLYWNSGYSVGDAKYSLPFSAGIGYRGTFFNMDLLKAAGVEKVPENWDELYEAAVKIKDAGVCEYPFLCPVAEDNASPLATYLPMLWSAGGDIVSADGTEVTIDSQAALDAAQHLYDLANKYGVLSQDSVTMQVTPVMDLFLEGKVAIMQAESSYIEQNADSINFEIASCLTIPKAGCEAITFSPVDTMSANANSDNVDAAAALCKWLCDTEHETDFKHVANTNSAKMTKDMEDLEIKLDCVREDMEKVATNGKPLPVCKGLSSMTEVIKTNEQLLVMGEITPEEAVKAMAEGCQAAMDE